MNREDVVSVRLGNILAERQMSPYELAKRCEGVSQSTIYNLVNGKRGVTVDTLQSICGGIGITMKDFFGEPDFLVTEEEKIFLIEYRALDGDQK